MSDDSNAVKIKNEQNQTVQLPQGRVNAPYKVELVFDGFSAGDINVTLNQGNIPTDLHITKDNGKSYISGTPKVATDEHGTSFQLQVYVIGNEDDAIIVRVKLTVVSQSELDNTALPPCMQTIKYTAQLKTKGGTNTSGKFKLLSGDKLPAGLNLSEDGKITGTPTEDIVDKKIYDFTVTLNSASEVLANYDLQIIQYPVIKITTMLLNPAYVGHAYKNTVNYLGGSGKLTSQLEAPKPDLLKGITYQATEHSFTGTPTDAFDADVIIKVTDSIDPSFVVSKTLKLQSQKVTPVTLVKPVAPSTVVGTLSIGHPFSEEIQAKGSFPPLHFSSKDLPKGLVLSDEGKITGQPEPIPDGNEMKLNSI